MSKALKYMESLLAQMTRNGDGSAIGCNHTCIGIKCVDCLFYDSSAHPTDKVKEVIAALNKGGNQDE